MASDRELGLDRPIDRRQFCQGTAVALGAGLAPWAQSIAGPVPGSPEIGKGYYPPALAGLRGAHPGSFEVAHGVVHQGRRWSSGTDTGEGRFDLVVIGAGISGLAAAWFYRRERPGARILLLDNHDDFGGHAKRNEFDIGGRRHIGYGGSQSIDTPSSYSEAARGLLNEIGIDLQAFYEAFDRGMYDRLGLQPGWWLDQPTFGIDRLVRGHPFAYGGGGMESAESLQRFAREITHTENDRAALLNLFTGNEDFLHGRSPAEKVAYLRTLSYDDCLRRHLGATDYIIRLINPLTCSYWGIGTDGISAREALFLGFPGFDGLGVDLERDDPHHGLDKNDPYIFHFPDGNAGIARLLVRSLVPGSLPGDSMRDSVTATADYTALDRPDNRVKIRLNATAVHLEHAGGRGSNGANQVNVRYVKDGEACDVAADQVIYAGYSAMLPHIAPEFPAAQAEAFATQVKVPLLYANMALRNWEAFAKLGLRSVRYPGGLMNRMELDFPVSLGDYEFARSPSDPMIVHWVYVPTVPHQGLDARTQNRLGRQRMLELGFEDYERAIRKQAADALSAGGFDPARDIVGLTVNRWPHGYAYEYNDLYDPPEFNRYNGPHVTARQPFGRVSIANSDAEAFAYVNGAIDAAWRAVRERLE
ncbi:FAD-dependent oxidoreductase [Elongatibacter sediminis]|uniref:FAD-dependent oxidoreductase n=1 Tax=Elongatibacter sediminis TaxID=3119006 RepID=A0AAW9RNK0_9GAMM